MRKRKRILFFPFELFSHYSRTLMLAQAVGDIHEVIFQDSLKYSGLLNQFNFPVFKCNHFDAEKILVHSKKFSFDWIEEEDLEALLLDQIRILKEYKPDIVIGDAVWTLKMAAEYCGIQYISLLNAYLSPKYKEIRCLPKNHIAQKYRNKLPGFFFNAMVKLGEAYAHRKYHSPFKKLRKKYNLKKVKLLPEELSGDLTLICDHPDLFPLNNYSNGHISLGPVFYRNNSKEELFLPELNRKTILISMGSSGETEKIRIFNNPLFECYDFIVTGESHNHGFSSNFTFRNFINLDKVLPKVNLLICHGGNGTIYHGLKHHIPILAIPSHFEHEWNMQQIKKSGLGDSINSEDNPTVIKAKIELWMNSKNDSEMKLDINPEKSFVKFREIIG
jgi:UDP:flavonoid glycosyltransferase YjiC (YdhE family)